MRSLQQTVAVPLPALPTPHVSAHPVGVAQRRRAVELVPHESALHEGPVGEFHETETVPLALETRRREGKMIIIVTMYCEKLAAK